MLASAPPADLLVVGAGPAGRILASRAAAAGLSVTLVDPAPDRVWPATYRAWEDELPAWLPVHVRAAVAEDVRAFARTEHRLDRRYVVLSTPDLQAWAAAEGGHGSSQGRVTVVSSAVVGRRVTGGVTHVVLPGGATLPGRVVVDASGPARVLTGGPAPGARAAQTAVGVVVPEGLGLPSLFMDWRADHGDPGWPSFLYAMPVGGGGVLLEETSLARRPGLNLSVLRRRLRDRLRARDIAVPADPEEEQVAFTVDTPLTRGTGDVVAFGAAAPIIHPATGYSLAASLRLVDPIVSALAQAPSDPAAAVRAVIWPRRARAVHHLRRRGLEVLLALPPAGVADFFEIFFSLDPAHQRAYISEREDLRAVSAAMWAVFRGADGPLRRHLVRHGGMAWNMGPS
ncbi:lycopene cyclase family protein [soil metagenome]